MDFVVGTASGVFLGTSGTSAKGMGEQGVRPLTQADSAVFAAASDGVYRSSDGGRSWSRSGVDAGEVWNIAVAPSDSRTLYASAQPAHLFVTRDRGETWQEVGTFLDAPGAERWCVPNSPQG